MQAIKTIIRALFRYPSTRISDNRTRMQDEIDAAAGYMPGQPKRLEVYRRLSDVPADINQMRWKGE